MQILRVSAGLLAAAAIGSAHAADPLLAESFDDISTLSGAGWIMTNASTSPAQPWFQGNSGVFPSYDGAAGAYIAASFLSSSAATGTIANWLITPELTLSGGEKISFYVRSESLDYSDGLIVKLSTSGSATSSFTTSLLTIAVAPDSWTMYTVDVPTLGAATTARIAFEYSVPNALDANYIGLDNVAITAAVPEPASAVLLGLGIAGLMLRRRAAA